MAPERTDRFLEELKTWTQRQGMTQVELGSKLGVSPQHVTEWFKGRKFPTGEQVLAMQELMGKDKRAQRKR
jgi:transcriptional regulator with XRE-family HTH domain